MSVTYIYRDEPWFLGGKFWFVVSIIFEVVFFFLLWLLLWFNNHNKHHKPYYEVILHDRRPYSQGDGVFESCVASINDLSLSCEKWSMIEGPKTKSRSNDSPQQKYRRYHRVIKSGNDKIHHLQTMDDFPIYNKPPFSLGIFKPRLRTTVSIVAIWLP